MTILGIDPGTTRAGYGVIRVEGGAHRLVAAGIMDVSAGSDKAVQLLGIQREIRRICKEYKPDLMAVEKLFFAKNRKTALAVAEARGVILLEARAAGLDTLEYSPTEVKASITGYGGADKKAVLKMVKLVLKEPGLAVIDDASDALALALAAAQDLRVRESRLGPAAARPVFS